MKRRVSILCLCAVLSFTISAQTVHKIGAYLGGSYLHTIFEPVKSTGYEAELGMLYELQHNSFLFDVGIGVAHQYDIERAKETMEIIRDNIVDVEGETYTLKYQFAERKDILTDYSIQLPLLFGGKFENFYFLLGGKLFYTFNNKYNCSALATTWGKYDYFDSDFTEMDNHGYRHDVMIETNNGKLTMLPKVFLSAELGISLTNAASRSLAVEYRLAAFVDYLAYNPYKHSKDAYHIPIATPFNFDSFVMTPMIASNDFETLKANQLHLGLRFTILFYRGNNASKQNCHNCKVYKEPIPHKPHNKKCNCVND